MRRFLATAGCATLLGCGVSSAEVSIGDSMTLGMHHARSGKTNLSLTVGSRTAACQPTRLAISWDDVAARIRAC